MSRRIVAAATLLAALAAPPVVAQVYGPAPPRAAGRTPVEALNGQYAERYGPRDATRECRREAGADIVVCANVSGAASPYRIPLPDARFAPGERVAHLSEAPSANRSTGHCNRPGCAEPSKLLETVGKIVTALKGEDPR